MSTLLSIGYTIRKTQRSRYRISRDVAREKNTKSTCKKVQCRINQKSTEKRGKIRGQMKKLFQTEIVTHWMAAILKTDLYSKLE
jgi:hypothetical protein